jgi:hypothetical protein
MKFKALVLLSLRALLVLTQTPPTPEEVNGAANGTGGVFGGRMGPPRAPKDGPAIPKGIEGAPQGADGGALINGGKAGGGWKGAVADNSGGSGPFNAYWTNDTSLPNHTIYAPRKVDATKKLPLLVWGNGECTFNI